MNEQNRQHAINLLNDIIKKERPDNRDDAEKLLDDVISKLVSVKLISIETKDEADEIKDAIYKDYIFPTKPGLSIVSEDVRNDKWLEEQENQTFPYTSRFKSYMDRGQGPSKSAVAAMMDDSYKIIQMLGNPSGRLFIRKGLLLGDVQSGKTSNYTAVMNRAVDVGYNVIILLAGSTDSLRTQTQKRIDRDLVGFTMGKDGNIGVGLETTGPDFVRRVRPVTSALFDFSKKIADTIPLQIGSESLLFVTKKNVTTMTAIKDALLKANRIAIDSNKIDASVLIIDDESDYASVNTNEETDPSHTNAVIRQLLNMFTRGSYLAVTATPFANIFIDSLTHTEKEGFDLFPSNFIHMLDRPAAYTGALKLFGDVELPDAQGKTYKEECLVPVRPSDMDKIPFRHKKIIAESINSFSDLPLLLQESIRYFLIVQRLMDYLPNPVEYRSMMINVSRFVKVQNRIADVIYRWINDEYIPQIKRGCRINGAWDFPDSGELYQVKKIWDRYDLSSKSGMTFSEFVPEILGNIRKLSVVAVNNSKKGSNTLSYTSEGERYIAVGGQCLSRGLTLETLVVSYFYRNSLAYDTLLQMCRWFGYRDRYLKYFKVWLSDDAIDWYSAITEATEDLRNQIELMNSQNLTPQMYGLRVKRSPGRGLLITARNKMRNVEKSDKIPVDLIGQLIETPRLYADSNYDISNNKMIGSFIDDLFSNVGEPGFVSYDSHEKNQSLIWRGINRKMISEFVSRFESDYLSYGYKINELTKYIKKNSTPIWSVIIQQVISKDIVEFDTPRGRKLSLSRMKRDYEEDSSDFDGKAIIKVSGHSVKVGSGDVAKLPLKSDELQALKARYSDWNSKKQNSRTYLISQPEDPLGHRDSFLILYPLRLEAGKEFDTKDNSIKWAIGVGFAGDKPAEDDAHCFVYYLNSVAINQKRLGEDEESDE